ncbi:hypothetical protein TRFO_38595 [Tritrichomonas foetus]|uniref:E3 ubiquitin-protein ligase listerin n=1 Tax=Tritrichomonas foetus TaxID=1144522 RepID=A0A1J4J7Y3_9EUKA|nr:hypothetical protein TRFO_38595 [Tritrichomonas foetus]|eukprot:OHS95306.1 hypothetical protein TRFO_38595 [Tritrichomonas foetus]
MSNKHSAPFRPKNVPVANFELFGGSNNVIQPAAISALKIKDRSIGDLFVQLSKNKKMVRTQAFQSLIDKIPGVKDKNEILNVAQPCYSVFDNSVSDYYIETRILSIQMIAEILKLINNKAKDQLPFTASIVFPPLLLLSCDTEKTVAEAAKGVFTEYFSTPEKRNAMMSKLRNEIANRIRRLFNELQKPKWDLTEAQTNENWGRLASMGLVLSTNLLIACKLSHDVFFSLGNPQIIEWLSTKNGGFGQKISPQTRASAYVFLSVTAQCKCIEVKVATIKSYIQYETSPYAQEKLIRLITALIEKKLIDGTALKEIILESLFLYYEPQKVGLQNVLKQLKDTQFIENCLTKASQSTDLNTGNNLFECIFSVGQDLISKEFLIDQLKKSISPHPSNKFYSQISLEFFKSLTEDPSIKEILNNADETKAAEFLTFCDLSKIIEWMKSRKEIKPETLVKIIQKIGSDPIRQVWPHIKDIPLVETNDINLVKFIILFAKTEEIEYVIENMQSCIPLLLLSWKGDLTPFKTQKLFDIAETLLAIDVKLIKILKQIFPGNDQLIKIVDESTRTHLKEDGEFDPAIFEYFTPSNDLLDDIIFSEAIEILEPTDTILIPLLVNRIIELVPTTEASQLAEIACLLIEKTEIDPIEICISPKDHPFFCYEYWKLIGFDNMNEPEFCELLECYLRKKSPFLPALLYMHDVNWNIIPKALNLYIKEHSELAFVAQQLNLLLALAAICQINDLDFSFFEELNGLTLFALPNKRPDVEKLNDPSDKLVQAIRCEWNLEVPSFPPDNEENSLRLMICYLQHFLPVIEDFNEITALAIKYIGSNDTLEFFYSLRILSMIYDADKPFDVKSVAKTIIEQVEKFYPLPPQVEAEVRNAFKITRFLTTEQIEPFIFEALPYFETRISQTVSRLIVPMIAYFNLWDIVDSRFNGRLDLDNVETWYFVTTALREMPYKRRIDTIPDFTSSLPKILTALDIKSPEFMTLITAFPSTAMKWYAKLKNNKSQPLSAYMETQGTQKVFQALATIAIQMKLESTIINEDARNRIITAVYSEDQTSVPVTLTISFPKIYPFAQINVSCDFGDEGDDCAYKVFAAMIGHQSIEAGIIAWHQFVTYRLKEAEPCTICYSYLSDEMKKPTIACPTCGQKFHGKCLQKWFSKCLKPTCPYCASAWDEKKRDKKK